MTRPLLFNHIPKTGGTTLRIILNRVYGVDKVFFINSKNINESVEKFKHMGVAERNSYKVISGHGAERFADLIENPFRVSIIREPISMFISQYHYLRQSTNSNFLADVSTLKSEEDYLDYAIGMGQDNLLTRYFSNSMQWLANPNIQIPNMEKNGKDLLGQAKENLLNYNFLTDLSNFDKGIFRLSQELRWSRIPMYRPSNITPKQNKQVNFSDNYYNRLKHILRWDIELYDYFKSEKLDAIFSETKVGYSYKLFMWRQNGISGLARLMGKN
ncbi:MAG: sulfotransferase family 2 domain-containing protein [Bacteroidetes bacterium]|nr:sulfotransferase family 2 domain-containing protein [Bacteroidota bacterium]